MKYFIFLLSFGLFNMAIAQQYPIPSPGSKWGMINYIYDFGSYSEVGENLEYSYRDTTLNNGKRYTAWLSKYPAYYTRYNSGKLFVNTTLQTDTTKDFLLYDFNLKTNDTFYYNTDYQHLWPFIAHDTLELMMNGQYRKRIEITGDFYYGIWIEGIGDVNNGVFYSFRTSAEWRTSIVCYSDTSGLVYRDTSNKVPCDSLDSYRITHYARSIHQKTSSDTKIQIVNHSITIISEEPVKLVHIYDIYGRCVLVSANIQIDVGDLPLGVYFISIDFKNGERVVEKLLIN